MASMQRIYYSVKSFSLYINFVVGRINIRLNLRNGIGERTSMRMNGNTLGGSLQSARRREEKAMSSLMLDPFQRSSSPKRSQDMSCPRFCQVREVNLKKLRNSDLTSSSSSESTSVGKHPDSYSPVNGCQ